MAKDVEAYKKITAGRSHGIGILVDCYSEIYKHTTTTRDMIYEFH
jgi:hypothetical protein